MKQTKDRSCYPGYFKFFYFLFPFLCIFFCSFVTIVHVINSFIRTLPIICQRPQPGRLTAYCFKISNQRSFLVLCCCCDYCHFDFLNWGVLFFFLNYELQDPVFLGSSHGVFKPQRRGNQHVWFCKLYTYGVPLWRAQVHHTIHQKRSKWPRRRLWVSMFDLTPVRNVS